MSYILEALKRAERERAQGQNPAVGDPAPTTPPPGSGRNTLLKVIIAALVVNALVIIVLVMRHKSPDAPAATSAGAPVALRSAAPTAPASAPITAPAPPPPSTEVATEEPAVQQGVSSMDDLGATTSDDQDQDQNAQATQSPPVEHHGSVTYAKKPLTRDVAPPTPPPDEGVTEDSSTNGADPEAAPPQAEPPTDEERMASAQPVAPRAAPPATAAPPPRSASSAAGSAKPLADMSAAYQGSFPPFILQVHVYDPSPLKRFAIIDGTRYREGDALPQGARIVQIVATGLVIDFQNERVLYPIGRH